MKKLMTLTLILVFSFASCDVLFNNKSGEIGKTGHGGGIIFFDEGGQYMECSGELGNNTWPAAVGAAENYIGGGFDDWRLPNKAELDLMYKNLYKNKLGGFSNSKYWTSETYDISRSWALDFDNGNQNYWNKDNSFSVRVVRSYVIESEINKNTTLRISNQSSVEITDVLWVNVTFENNKFENSIKPGTDVKNTVQPAGGYIFFKRKTSPIIARTKEMVIVEKDQQIEFTFLDNTVIEELNNLSNIGTLKSLQSTVVWWDDAEDQIQPYSERVSAGYYSGSGNLPVINDLTPYFYTPKNGTKSIAIGGTNNSRLCINVDLERNAEISFWYANKANGTDGTIFTINGTEVKKWTENFEWAFMNFDLSSGMNDIIWQKNDGIDDNNIYYLSLDDILIKYTK